MDPGELLKTLWARAVGEGVHVSYHAPINAPDALRWNMGERGYFAPRWEDQHGHENPHIWLYRSRAPDAQDQPDALTQPLEDLLCLAHLYGHFFVYRTCERSEECERGDFDDISAWPSLPASAKAALLNDDELAWQRAEEALRDLGFDVWDSFNEKKQHSMEAIRALLDATPPRLPPIEERPVSSAQDRGNWETDWLPRFYQNKGTLSLRSITGAKFCDQLRRAGAQTTPARLRAAVWDFYDSRVESVSVKDVRFLFPDDDGTVDELVERYFALGQPDIAT